MAGSRTLLVLVLVEQISGPGTTALLTTPATTRTGTITSPPEKNQTSDNGRRQTEYTGSTDAPSSTLRPGTTALLTTPATTRTGTITSPPEKNQTSDNGRRQTEYTGSTDAPSSTLRPGTTALLTTPATTRTGTITSPPEKNQTSDNGRRQTEYTGSTAAPSSTLNHTSPTTRSPTRSPMGPFEQPSTHTRPGQTELSGAELAAVSFSAAAVLLVGVVVFLGWNKAKGRTGPESHKDKLSTL